MKKISIYLLLLTMPLCTHAQLSITHSGQVRIATSDSIANNAKLTIESPENITTNENITIHSCMRTIKDSTNIGINGIVMPTNPGHGKAIGVRGLACGGNNGLNFGVLGSLIGNSTYGAGVFGSISYPQGITVPGKYAGYFAGEVLVAGQLTSGAYILPSDIRLKENVTPLRSASSELTTLNQVLNMNVVQYNYKDHISINMTNVSDTDESTSKKNNLLHFGLIAQELQEIYPNLIHEGQDGYLGINYVEMVPVLIRAIQELKEEIDELKGTGTARKSPTVSTTSVDNAKGNNNMLYQNTPNPAKNQTIIRYQLAEDAQDAAICIFDMTGKQVKKFPISSGTNNVVINGYELGQGMFLYSLIVNGQEIDTKKMIISK